jgi:spore coat protein H
MALSKNRCVIHFVYVVALALASFFAASLHADDAPPSKALPKTPAELFQETTIWNLHLKLTAEQWQAMEPKGGGGFGGGPGGGGGFRGPTFRSSPMLAPAIVYFGGADNQGRLSRDAFTTLAAKWFTAWDTDKSGVLDNQKLRNGLGAIPSTGRGFGMNLQGPDGGRNGIAAALGIEYAFVHADLEFEGQAFKDVAVRYKGGGTFLESRESTKRPLKVSLNHYTKGQKLAGVTTLNLANCITDASWMNEVLAHRLYRDASVPAPRTAYARVYLTVPGKYESQYLGLYSSGGRKPGEALRPGSAGHERRRDPQACHAEPFCRPRQRLEVLQADLRRQDQALRQAGPPDH